MKRTRNAIAASFVALGLLVAACGGDDSGTTSETTSAATTAAATTATTAGGATTAAQATTTTTAAPSFDKNATFTYGEGAVTSLDPTLARTLYDNTYLYPVFDRLVHYDNNGNTIPGLALKWAFTDPTTFELELRTGVVFHDGTPFDAAAVVANLDRSRTGEKSLVKGELAMIDKVEAVSPAKVKVTLKSPAATLPLILADRAGMMMSPKSFTDPAVDRNPVGTGMYQFVKYVDGDVVEYKRNEKYWNPDDVKNAVLRIKIIGDDAARLNALRSGQLDATWVDESAVANLKSAGFKVEVISKLGLFHLQLNRNQAPFNNPLVRRALNHAIDRTAITKGVLFDLAIPTVQPFPEGNLGYNPALKVSDVKYDPALAKKLLADAGLSGGVSFNCFVVNTSGYIARTEAVQAMLAEVGIKMNIQIIAGGDIIPKFYQNQEAPCASTPFGGRLDPAQTIGLMFSDTGSLNPGKGTTPRILEILKSSLAETDQAKRKTLFQEFSKIYVDEALNIPLHYMSFPFAHRDGVLGVKGLFDVRPFDIRGVGVKAR